MEGVGSKCEFKLSTPPIAGQLPVRALPTPDFSVRDDLGALTAWGSGDDLRDGTHSFVSSRFQERPCGREEVMCIQA